MQETTDDSTDDDRHELVRKPSFRRSHRNFKLPPMENRPVPDEEDSLDHIRVTMATPAYDKRRTSRDSPQPRLFVITVDVEARNYNKDLTNLLNAHSYGVPLIVSFSSHKAVSQFEFSSISGVRGIFHCHKCYVSWNSIRTVPTSCEEDGNYVGGPFISISDEDAVNLVGTLLWSKRYSTAVMKNTFPLLRNAGSAESLTCILKSIPSPKPSKTDAGEDASKTLVQRECLKMRSNVFLNNEEVILPDSADESRWSREDLFAKMKLIGMRGNDGSFYPGFFSARRRTHDQLKRILQLHTEESLISIGRNESQNSMNDLTEVSLDNYIFVAGGRIDDDGCYHDYASADELYTPDDVQFPNVGVIIDAQREAVFSGITPSPSLSEDSGGIETFLTPSKSHVLLPSKFTFSMQEGTELHLNEILSNGIWYKQGMYEHYFSGVFDSDGNFSAAFCISSEGYLISGATNDKGKFIPFTTYAGSNRDLISAQFDAGDLTDAQLAVLNRVQRLPKFPNACKLDLEENFAWRYIRDGSIVTDPAHIAFFKEGVSAENENLTIYAGGEIGPNGQLYFYGYYGDDDTFTEGGPPLKVSSELQLLRNDVDYQRAALERFSRKFGIRFHEDFRTMKMRLSFVDPLNPELKNDTRLKPLLSQSSQLEIAKEKNNEEKVDRDTDAASRSKSPMTWFSSPQKKLYTELQKIQVDEKEFLPPKHSETEESMNQTKVHKPVIRSSVLSQEMKHLNDSLEERNSISFSGNDLMEISILSSSASDPTAAKADQSSSKHGSQKVRRPKKTIGHLRSKKNAPEVQNPAAEPEKMKYSSGLTTKITASAEEVKPMEFINFYNKQKITARNKINDSTLEKDVQIIGSKQETDEKRAQPVVEVKQNPPKKTTRIETMVRKEPKKEQKDVKAAGELKPKDPHEKRKLSTSIIKERLLNVGFINKEEPQDENNPEEKEKPPVEHEAGEDKPEFSWRNAEPRKPSYESPVLPKLNFLSILNFTQSYKFSYFEMPEHVREYNEKCRRGSLELPSIKKSEDGSTHQLTPRSNKKRAMPFKLISEQKSIEK